MSRVASKRGRRSRSRRLIVNFDEGTRVYTSDDLDRCTAR